MSSVLANKEDKIRGYLYGRLKAAKAPSMAAGPCDGQEGVNLSQMHSPGGVLVTWERISFQDTTCDYRGRTSAQEWEWKAILQWGCRVSTTHYLDELSKEPLIVDGERNEQGRMVTSATVVLLTSAELEDIPAQGSEVGPRLVLTFEVTNKK